MGKVVRKVGDSGPMSKITIRVRGRDRSPIDLTGYLASLIVGTKSDNLFVGSCTVTDAVNGEIEYTPVAGNFATAGEYSLQVKIVGDGLPGGGTGTIYIDAGTIIVESPLPEA
jgi:hypothetical protein